MKRKTHYKALSDEEIKLFKGFPIKKYPFYELGYYYFLFSYYCFGLNLKDIIQLTKGDIEGDVLYWDRSKTGFEGCAILQKLLFSFGNKRFKKKHEEQDFPIEFEAKRCYVSINRNSLQFTIFRLCRKIIADFPQRAIHKTVSLHYK